MAKSPEWKVYDSNGEYQAACKHVQLAAPVVSLLGEGATIRFGHRLIVWTEGKDGWSMESYDETVEVAVRNLNEATGGKYRLVW